MGLDSMNDIEIDVDDWITDSFAGINRESTRTSWERHQELRGLGATAASDWRVKLMQQTLAQLGRQANDASVSSIVADGVLGPKTLAAVNRALKFHVGTNTTQYLRSGTLSQDAVMLNIVVISGALASEVIRRGDVPPPKPVARTTTPKKPVPQLAPIVAPPADPWYVVHKTKLMIGGGVLLAIGVAFAALGGKGEADISDY